MKSRIFKQILFSVLLIISINFVSAANMTIQQLADSYNYSFSTGVISIASQNDYMIDADNDGLNDTLIFNITISPINFGTYRFIAEIMDSKGILINDTLKNVNSSETSVNVSFPSELLSKSRFNYSLIIKDVNEDLVFRNFNIESQTYNKFKTGTNITKITDENINNNFLRINLTINSTQAILSNVTVTLSFNSSKISQNKENNLSNGIQVVSIDFDNETIKSTHYVGNFTIDSIVVGNKVFNPNQNTSIYSYEDFAQTSYIKSIADGRIDTNANNLSEFLEINFTINVKTADTYNITYDLYDQFNNFVISVNKTQTLALGNQIVQTLINGSDIYKTKINGPYLLSFVKLAVGNDTKDIIYNAYTTNQSFYTDFERPPLPDLKVGMGVIFNPTTNTTNITVNISNIGQAPAFNVFLDVFDNITYTNNRSLSFMDVNQTITYQFNITNSSNTTLYTSIVDFNNLVDESNESNNIAQNSNLQVVSLKIESINQTYNNGTLKIFEFVILNDGQAPVTNVQWQFDTNDNNVINSTSNISSLAINEKAFVYLQYNFSVMGNYDVKANATGISSSTIVSSFSSTNVGVGDLAIASFSNLNLSANAVIFEIQAKNALLTNITNVNWSIAAGNGQIINSTSPFSALQSNETVFVYVNYDYGTNGTFSPTASVTNGTYSDSKSITLNVST